MAGAYPSFCSMKQPRVLLLPLDGMLVNHRVTPAACHRYPFIHLGGERQSGVKPLVYGNNTMTGTGRLTTNLQILSPMH